MTFIQHQIHPSPNISNNSHIQSEKSQNYSNKMQSYNSQTASSMSSHHNHHPGSSPHSHPYANNSYANNFHSLDTSMQSTETKSSAPSRGSAVLARAREYNRIIDEKNQSRSTNGNRASRSGGGGYSVSPPRSGIGGGGSGRSEHSHSNDRHSHAYELHRSKSAPRTGTGTGTGASGAEDIYYNGQRERAMASVRASSPMTTKLQSQPQSQQSNSRRAMSATQDSASASAKTNTNASSPSADAQHNHNPHNQQHQHQPQRQQTRYRSSPTPSQKSASARTHKSSTTHHNRNHLHSRSPKSAYNKENNYRSQQQRTHAKSSQQRLNPTAKSTHDQNNNNNNNNNQAIVTPELLVDALSGHEDGLLAIAERLMEHYDSGYDAMGEAIIDAFADVQKLFQHVVEAAHMEGAAYEAGRREEEIEQLKRALGGENGIGGVGDTNDQQQQQQQQQQQNNGGVSGGGGGNSRHNNSASSPVRHEEFVDQDVRDVLVDAIRKGQSYKDAQKFHECYQLFEQACNSASALLPVDSDHRGRLQLSIARAESMNAERACAILKYVMDDVLRSGLTSNSKVVMPDPSQRGDCVLSRPPPTSKIIDDSSLNSKYNGTTVAGGNGGVVLQSSEEALASMVEEMKEILSAPVYDNSPLQSVADRFWTSLNEAQKNNMKTEERLEQKLGELKGDFLLAKMVCLRYICILLV